MRQVVLDTETTGLDPAQGHRIIEIGCVEMVNRRLTGRHYHQYIRPDREIDAGAMEVHGITNEFLADKPAFAQITEAFIEFVDGAELVIHNAPFDVGFLDAEFARLNVKTRIDTICTVEDSLVLARRRHPGQRNSLDALCSRYGVDNSQRDLHGALLDAEILADVYLLLTGGQSDLGLGSESGTSNDGGGQAIRRLSKDRAPLKVLAATADELLAHEAQLEKIDKASDGNTVWRLPAAG